MSRFWRAGCDAGLAWRGLTVALAVVAMLHPTVGMAADPPETTAPTPEYDRDAAYSQGYVDRSTIDIDKHLVPFLPNRRGDFILPWWTLAEQVSEGLGVAPLDTRALPNGRRLLWGCRWHSCTEKAAVIVSAGGKVEAAALIHAGCHMTAFPDRGSERWRKSHYTCVDEMTLTVFLHVEQTYRADLEQWAKAVSRQPFKVEIYWV